MEIKHNIRTFNPDTGSIEVHYYADNFSSDFVYNIDLPILDGKYPSKEEIDAIINMMKPTEQIKRMAALTKVQPPADLLAFKRTANEKGGGGSKADEIRARRNMLLAESDFSQLADSPFSEIEKSAWAQYRQELRDLTEQAGFPDTVVFPATPSIEPR